MSPAPSHLRVVSTVMSHAAARALRGLSRFLIPTISVAVTLGIGVGCYTLHYYRPSIDEVQIAGKPILFDVGNVDWVIKAAKSGNPSSEAFIKAHWSYRQFVPDSNLTYYSLVVGVPYTDTLCMSQSGRPKPCTDTLFWFGRADSVRIRLAPPFEAPPFNAFPQEMGYPDEWAGRGYRAFGISPIGIPKGYKQDFEVDFVLSLHQVSDSSLVERVPVHLVCRHKKKVGSTIWPGA